MKKLLNVGPYTTIKLTKEEKEKLVYLLKADEEDVFDTDCDWFLTNDPKLDDLDDGREDFWNKGEEYPFPYSLLIGGNTVNNHYESFSRYVIEGEGFAKYFPELK